MSTTGIEEDYPQIEAEPGVVHPPTILIADDDPGLVRALSGRCSRLGLNVITATDGLQAIIKAKRGRPDVTIVDINMPQVDGFEVCRWLLSPQRPSSEVIVLTGLRSEEVFDRCDSIGVHYVAKSSQTWEDIRRILSSMFEGPIRDNDAEIPVQVAPAKLPVPGARVLLVDDDPDMVAVLENRIRKLGAAVFVAHNGIEAYRVAVRERPHLVIADYSMPEAGGHYLMWRMHADAELAEVPIFLITGLQFGSDTTGLTEDDLLGPGRAARLFRKPFKTELLLEAVREHCDLLVPTRAGA
ncbi:MAG TPA: response regulator [Alphaproteobacteria bacterium]|nr:response regulator [Alphaproteobacteria bacterium]